MDTETVPIPDNNNNNNNAVSSAEGATTDNAKKDSHSSLTNTENVSKPSTPAQAQIKIPQDLLPGPCELPAEPIPGMHPIFITSMTQDLFKLKTGEDVTAERPIKMIPKSDILSDLQSRAAISDWFPIKPLILEFPKEEILVHYDADFKYTQNFFVCLTQEAIDTIVALYLPVVETISEEEAASIALKKNRPKEWISLGSEKEIEMETIIPSRDPIIVKLSRKRREFNAVCKFSDKDSHDGFLECRPYRDANFEVNRMEVQLGIQAIPTLTQHSTQTSWYRPLNFSAQYEPISMPTTEQSVHVSSKLMEDFCRNVLIKFEIALQQNELTDIFSDDFKRLGEEEFSVGNNSQIVLQEYQSFTDLKHSKDKSISCIDWHPNQKGVLAISCVKQSTLDDRIEASYNAHAEKSVILIWSFQDPIHPQLILEAPDDVYAFQFNPEEPHIIVGGCVNGQVALWDISEFEEKLKSARKAATKEENSTLSSGKSNNDTPRIPFTLCSSIEASHKSTITDLKWLPKTSELGHNGDIVETPENGHKQFYTCSLDGSVSFWDMRYKKDYQSLDLTWRPFLKIPLTSMDNTFDYGITKLSLIPPTLAGKGAVPMSQTNSSGANTASQASTSSRPGQHHASQTKFYCATEEGDLTYADWLTDKASEEKVSRVEHVYGGHFGPMSDLQRSPFFPDIILSIGGWTFHIWKEKNSTGPLLSSGVSESYIICGKWSPTRPGVFYICRSDGSIEVWDILDKSHAPSVTQNIASAPVSNLQIHQYPGKSLVGHQFIAAGDDEGTLHIFEVPKNLTKPVRNEKVIVSNFFEREIKRLYYSQERKKIRNQEKVLHEAALQEATAALAKVKADVPPPSSSTDESKAQDPDQNEENAYKKIEKEFLISQGLLIEQELVSTDA